MSSLVKRHELYKISPDPSLPKRGRSNFPFAKGGKILNSPFGKGGLRGIFNGKGFTLIETVMVITLLGIIGGIIAPPLYQATRGWFEVTARERITESGRIAMERMTREIRNTARKADNTPCISAVTATSFSFSDVSGDLSACNTTTFSISGTNLLRGADTLADNVSSMTIQYYDSNNQCMLAQPNCPSPIGVNINNIRRLSIEIVSTRGGETARKYSEVYLSNMKGY